MGALARIRRRIAIRLAAEGGFTLTELLIALAIGSIVILAAANLMDSSGRAATAVADRVDATQRGRVAMEQITQRLHSQVCPAQDTTPILYGDANRVTLYTDLVGADPTFIPEARSIYYSPGTNAQTDPSALREDVFRYTNSESTPLPSAAQITDFKRPVPTGAPTSRHAFIANIAPIRDGGGASQPVFVYFGFNDDNPGLALRELPVPLSDADKKRVVRVTVSFDSRPTSGDVQDGATRNKRKELDSRFENQVYVQSADPLQRERDPAPCI